MTKKGKDLMERSTVSGGNLFRIYFPVFPMKDLRVLNGMLEKMREKAIVYLNPGKSLEAVETDDVENMPVFWHG
jgi:hypothetical protein